MNKAASAALLALTAGLLMTGCMTSGPRNEGQRMTRAEAREQFRRPNPSRVIAHELAFARAAQEKGQWAAFREYSTSEAVMFVPEPVNAHEWLRRQTEPAEAVRWQPQQVWSSCDGSFAVTEGAAQHPGGRTGRFVTIWRKMRDGGYRWVLDRASDGPDRQPAVEMISSQLPDCGTPAPGRSDAGALAFPASGQSEDRTLAWSTTQTSDGRHVTEVFIYLDGAYRSVLDEATWRGLPGS